MNHIVLFEPEIPQNAGNIIRTCVAHNFKLHLIEPMGFSLQDKYVKRSAVNHLKHLDYKVYVTLDEFFEKNDGAFYFLTRYGQKSPDRMDFADTSREIYLIFGSESTGIPRPILARHKANLLRIPMTDNVRSLNLSNSVAILAYEVTRQQGFEGLYPHEPDTLKGKDYLDQ